MSQTINSILGLFDGVALITTSNEKMTLTPNVVTKIAAWAAIPEGETVIAVTPIDLTLSGKKGLAICSSGIFWKNGIVHEPMKLTWEQLAHTTDSLIAHPKTKHLEFVGGKYYDTPHAFMTNTVLKDLLIRLAAHWEQSQDEFATQAEDVGLPVTAVVQEEKTPPPQTEAKTEAEPPSNQATADRQTTKKKSKKKTLAHWALFFLSIIFPIAGNFIGSILGFYTLWAIVGLVRPELGFSESKHTNKNVLIVCGIFFFLFVIGAQSYEEYMAKNKSSVTTAPPPSTAPQQATANKKSRQPMVVRAYTNNKNTETLAEALDSVGYGFSEERGNFKNYVNPQTGQIGVWLKVQSTRDQPTEYLIEDIERAMILGLYAKFIHTNAITALIKVSLVDMNDQEIHPHLSQTLMVKRERALIALHDSGVAKNFNELLEQRCYGEDCTTSLSNKFDRILYNDYQPGRTRVLNYLKTHSTGR